MQTQEKFAKFICSCKKPETKSINIRIHELKKPPWGSDLATRLVNQGSWVRAQASPVFAMAHLSMTLAVGET